MVLNKSILATIATTAMFLSKASAFTGTAFEGFGGIPNCGCAASNGPFTIALPAALIPTAACCDVQINLSFNGTNTTAVYSANYVAGAGTENILLSEAAFEALAGPGSTAPISPVEWSIYP